ncbi:AraC family transcriptional regulator [Vagococcus sp.]|uniref:AraC family transcriptional regulator n=1 Tax=Vagococcus sp. TaxID=1933889 RepID=UPI003F977D0C
MARIYRDIFVNTPVFSDFYFYNIGHENCRSKHEYGPNIREKYIIHYIVNGQGTYKVKDQIFHLKKGQFFIIRPNDIIHYQADDKNPWEYYWLGIGGSKIEDILTSCNIHPHSYVGQIKQSNKQIKYLFELLMKSKHFDYLKLLEIYTVFFQLINSLEGEKNFTLPNLSKMTKKRYSKSFILYVQNSYHLSSLSIYHIANSMSLNPSYLSQVIKEELGVTPISYLKGFRLHKASILLEMGNHTVSETAKQVGYDNEQSFSRAFKQRFGVPPSRYKGNH